MSATAQTAGPMIAAGPAHTFLAHCHSPQLLTSRKPNNDEAHNQAKAGEQAAEVNPWRCSTASARGWWKHVSWRLRLHSRTSLRVICQYTARAPALLLPPRLACVYSTRGSALPEGAAPSSPRPRPRLPCCSDCRPPSRHHSCAAPARPPARSSAPRRRGPAPRWPARAVRPSQGDSAARVHYGQDRVGRASGRAGVGG
jgi:hypothetical protein